MRATSKRTIKLKLITTAELEAFFHLDSPGYFIAKKAVECGEVSAAVDVLEVLVLANKLFEIDFRERVALALEAYGRADEYLNAPESDRALKIVIETLGAGRIKAILRETYDFVKQESKVGLGVNEKG